MDRRAIIDKLQAKIDKLQAELDTHKRYAADFAQTYAYCRQQIQRLENPPAARHPKRETRRRKVWGYWYLLKFRAIVRNAPRGVLLRFCIKSHRNNYKYLIKV